MKFVIASAEELQKRNIVPLMKISPESVLAHKYLDELNGIEIGAATYQPFGLQSINVSTGETSDREFYKSIQLMVMGSYYTIDIEAEAHDLPLEDSSQDYIVASHVLEHCCNPIGVFLEWKRVIKHGGFIYLIVPKREAPYGDADREISPLSHFMQAYRENWDNRQAYKKMWDRPTPEFDRFRGHIWVFDTLSLCHLIQHCNTWYDLNWTLLEAHDTDDKDGLGHMMIFRNN